MTCTRCESTGFLNVDQVPEEAYEQGTEAILAWMATTVEDHDVSVCDCCGDGETWYGEEGVHYSGEDDNCYDYNGGLPECY